MLTTTRARLTALVATGAMSLGAAGAAEAQTQQEGLVNVNVENVTAQVPIGIAANVCDVNANVLAEQLRQGGAECDADAESIATNGPGHGGSTRLPGRSAVAANVCDVNVGVLSRQLRLGGAECDATADAIADNG